MDTIKKNLGFSILGDSISTLGGWIPDGWRIHYEGEVHVDGITEPAHTWWGQVIDHFGGHLVANSSFSGSTAEGFGFPAGTSQQRIDGLFGPQGEKPDVVLVFLGINDYGWGSPRNQVIGGSKSATADLCDLTGPRGFVGTVGPAELKGFRDAYGQILAMIHESAPAAEVWCLTLMPGTAPSGLPHFRYCMHGLELDDYNQAIRSTAAENAAHVADIRSFDVCYDAVDGVHPSALGMSQIAAMVVNQIEGEGPATLDELIAGAPRPHRSCFKPTCEGCDLSEDEPSHWLLHCSKQN